jgi:anti-sigma B factor antagonist
VFALHKPVDVAHQRVAWESAGAGSPAWEQHMTEFGELPTLDHTGSLMRVTRRKDVGNVTVFVEGDIGLLTRGKLDSELQGAERLATEGDRLVLDLGGVSFLGAVGLHVLLGSERRCADRGVRFLVVAKHRVVTRPIQLAGLAGRLHLVSRPPTGAG